MTNREIEGSQHTVCWHVDDIKSSHKSSKVQDEFEDWLIDTYDKDSKRKVVSTLK